MLICFPSGLRHPVQLKPLSARLENLKNKKICFFFSWQAATLYEGSFAQRMKTLFEAEGSTVSFRKKRRAFDQNDPEERLELSKEFDAVVYFGASSCSTSKYAAIFGGLLDSDCQTPCVAVTYKTFVPDCEHANIDNGTRTRCIFTDYPGDNLSDADIRKIFFKILSALTKALSENEKRIGSYQFSPPPEVVDVEDPQNFLYDSRLTDGNPVIIPTLEKVKEMLSGTSLAPDKIVAEKVWPNCSAATVRTVGIIAVMAGLPPKALPIACAIAKAYSDAPGQALVVSTNSFGFLPVIKGPVVNELGLNFQEHAMSSVPGTLNAALGRFLRLLQIAIGGWKQGENAFGVIGNPMLGCSALAENPSYSNSRTSSVTLVTGCWSFFGNYMNMDFQNLIDMAKHCDYQTGLFCVVSPKRADDLIKQFGSLDLAGRHYQENSKISLKEFWDAQDWHKVFTKPQLELGSAKGELQGYPQEYLEYFEDPDQKAQVQVPAFPRGGIRFVVAGGSGSKMLRAIHGAPVSTVSVESFQ